MTKQEFIILIICLFQAWGLYEGWKSLQELPPADRRGVILLGGALVLALLFVLPGLWLFFVWLGKHNL